MTTSPLFDNPIVFKLAREATRQAIAELDRMPRNQLDTGNPNHPMYDNKLFGYGVQEFLAKQYK